MRKEIKRVKNGIIEIYHEESSDFNERGHIKLAYPEKAIWIEADGKRFLHIAFAKRVVRDGKEQYCKCGQQLCRHDESIYCPRCDRVQGSKERG